MKHLNVACGALLVLVGSCSSAPRRAPANASATLLNPAVFGGQANCSELLAHIQEGILPAKFTYLGKGAELWKTLMRNSNSVANDPEMKLLAIRIAALQKTNFPHGANVVDIGPGDGRKATEILMHWNAGQVRYLALDISAEVITLARDTITEKIAGLSFESRIVDFEKENCRDTIKKIERASGKPSLFLLLGQTVGNPGDIPRFLSNVQRSMLKNSVLLVGLDLYQDDKIPALLQQYHDPAYLDMDLWVLKEVGLIPGINGNVKVDFDIPARDIRGIFHLSKDVTIVSPGDATHRPEPVHLKKGQEIVFFRSHRFTEYEIYGTFSQAGLRVMDLQKDPQTGYALVTAIP